MQLLGKVLVPQNKLNIQRTNFHFTGWWLWILCFHFKEDLEQGGTLYIPSASHNVPFCRYSFNEPWWILRCVCVLLQEHKKQHQMSRLRMCGRNFPFSRMWTLGGQDRMLTLVKRDHIKLLCQELEDGSLRSWRIVEIWFVETSRSPSKWSDT